MYVYIYRYIYICMYIYTDIDICRYMYTRDYTSNNKNFTLENE